MVGKTIAHHEVTAKLGDGGMSVAYKARDNLDKWIKPGFVQIQWPIDVHSDY